MPRFCYPYKRGTGWRSQGFRSNPNTGANGAGGHTGYDQAMDANTPIYAPGDGIVRNSSWVTDDYLENPWWLTQMGGDILVLDCTDSFGRSDTMPTFIFAHLSSSIAEVGQRVRKGELIALSGNSGTASTGPHLHTEALPPNWDFNNGVYGRVDPEQYFTEWPEDITQGGAAIGPQGVTINPIKEDTLSAAEVQEIKDHINLVVYGGTTWKNEKRYPLYDVAAHTQVLIADVPRRVWGTVVRRTTGSLTVLQDLVNGVTGILGLQPAVAEIQKNTADDIAAGIPDDLAKQVIDALATRLGGK